MMATIRRALVSDCGRTFSLVDVQPWVLDDAEQRRSLVDDAAAMLGGAVALAARVGSRQWRVWGHRDDLRALQGHAIGELDWEDRAVVAAPLAQTKELHTACAGTGRRDCPSCEGRGYVYGPHGDRRSCPGLCRSGSIECRPCQGTGYY